MNFKRKNFVLTVIINILFFYSISLCQSAPYDSLKSYQLEPVVVTGTRYEEPKNVLPASITVIDSMEISENHDVNVIRTLSSRVPGLFLNSNNFMGFGVGSNSAGTINIRGIGGNPNTEVLVLIDGQPQFMGMFGHPIIDALTSSSVQRVEIIRGPASILYGSNALGGAINIITHKIPSNKFKVGFSSFYGSHNSWNGSFNSGYQNNKFGFFFSFDKTQTDGHRKDSDDGFKNSTGFGKINYQLNNKFKLTLDGSISKAKYFDPGPSDSLFQNNFYNYLRSRGAFSIMNSFNNINGAFKFFYSYGKHDFFDGWNSYDDMKGITFYQNLNFVNRAILTAGIDYKNYGGKGTNPNIPPGVLKGLNRYYSNNEWSAYILIKDSLFRNLNIQTGVRYSYNSIFNSEYTPQFGLTYSISKSTTLKGIIGKGYQAPTIVDLYLFPISNENLKPERLWNYEAGIEQMLFDKRLNLEFTTYYDEGRNIILITPPFFVKNNSGSFIHKGIEIEGKFLINDNLSTAINYSYLSTDKPALYAPKHNLNLHFDFHYKSFQALLDFNEISGLYSNMEKSLKQNYFLTNIVLNYSIINSIEVFARGENLFDKQYEINDGYPMPGRTIIAGIKVIYW